MLCAFASVPRKETKMIKINNIPIIKKTMDLTAYVSKILYTKTILKEILMVIPFKVALLKVMDSSNKLSLLYLGIKITK